MSNQTTLEPETDAVDDTLIHESLRAIFPPRTPIWLTERHYQANGPVWQITLICPGPRGSWMRRRYRIDIPSETMQFAGEEPISEADFEEARNNGQRLRI